MSKTLQLCDIQQWKLDYFSLRINSSLRYVDAIENFALIGMTDGEEVSPSEKLSFDCLFRISNERH